MSLKEGLSYLIEKAHQRGINIHYDQKTVIAPVYSFISQLINSLKRFLNCQDYEYWYAYFLDQHLHERSLSNMIKSWQKLKTTSLQCHLLQNILIVNNRSKIKLYLKARKFILQTTSNSDMIDEVLLTLQDAISIIYKLYTNQPIRKIIGTGIKNIFVAFKLSQAKIYSTVFIQYLLSVYDSVFRLESEEATISDQFNTYKQISKSNNSNSNELYSSIQNFQSTIHEDNGLYKKTSFNQANHRKYQIIDRKFLPLKQTSQFSSSNQKSNAPQYFNQKNSHNSHHKDKEKSTFHDFIIKSSLQRKQQKIQDQSSESLKINAFYNSSDKKQNYQEKNIESFSKGAHNIKRNYQLTQPAKFMIKNGDGAKYDSKFSEKKFSLNNFGKRQFDSSVQQGKQSILRNSKARIKRQAQRDQIQHRKHQISFDSTQRFEIQNHLMNMDSINFPLQEKSSFKQSTSRFHGSIQQQKEQNNRFYNKNRSNIKKESHFSKASSSVTQQQFDKMISKNQLFKEKMLKKNYPSVSFTSNDAGTNSIEKNQVREAYSLQFYQDKIDIIIDKNSLKLKRTSQEKEQQREKNISFNNNRLKQRQRYPNNIYHTRNDYRKDFQENYKQNYKKEEPSKKIDINEKKILQNLPIQQLQYEKAQIIHKSVGQTQRRHHLNQQENQNYYKQGNTSNKKSLHVQKMKQMIKVIDNYNKIMPYNNDEDSDENNQNAKQEQFLGINRFQEQKWISQSSCKKPRFQSYRDNQQYPNSQLQQIEKKQFYNGQFGDQYSFYS